MVSEKNHPGKVSHFMEVYLPLPRHSINLNNPPGKKKIQATLCKVKSIWVKGK